MSSSSTTSTSGSVTWKRKLHQKVAKADLQPTVVLKANTPNLIPACHAAAAAPVEESSSIFTKQNIIIFVGIVAVLVIAYFVYKKWNVISTLGVAYAAPQLGGTDVSAKHAEEEVKLLEEGKHPFVKPVEQPIVAAVVPPIVPPAPVPTVVAPAPVEEKK